MDLQDTPFLIAMAASERKRKEEKLLRDRRAALRQKAKQCEILKKNNQNLLAAEAPKEKMVEYFMLFIAAIDRNDTERIQKFDEKSMMETILNLMNGGGGDSGHNGW